MAAYCYAPGAFLERQVGSTNRKLDQVTAVSLIEVAASSERELAPASFQRIFVFRYCVREASV